MWAVLLSSYGNSMTAIFVYSNCSCDSEHSIVHTMELRAFDYQILYFLTAYILADSCDMGTKDFPDLPDILYYADVYAQSLKAAGLRMCISGK